MRIKGAKQRRDRQYPQVELVFSTAFPSAFNSHSSMCFVPYEDFRKLQKKYLNLFLKYQKSKAL